VSGGVESEAYEQLQQSVVTLHGEPVGTVAARDPAARSLNYDQVFTRDFAVSAVAFLVLDEPAIVRQFLIRSVELQSRQRHMDCFRPGQGLMPASFKVASQATAEPTIVADFGEKAIGKVTPVDAPLWWFYILRSYVQFTGDTALAERSDFQQAMRLILDLCLTTRFDMFPTLLVPDGAFMIDRRLGVHGYPLEIQMLFYMALRSALELLAPSEENQPYIDASRERAGHLLYHLRRYYWIDADRITALRRAKVEDYGDGSINPLNIYPESLPPWLESWLTDDVGYFAGNIGPGRLDVRFFSGGNLLAILSGLANKRYQQRLINLIRLRWDELIAAMPIKAVYPAVERESWALVTGRDPKNTPWSYHNGGHWPFLVWLLSAAAVKSNAMDLGRAALDTAAPRLAADRWPEYYDGRFGRFVGKAARLHQTWSAAGYLAGARLIEQPELSRLLCFEADDLVNACAERVQRNDLAAES